MPARKGPSRKPSTSELVEEVLDRLQAKSSKKIREEMGTRYGIYTDKALGVSMSVMQKIAKDLGPNHQLAQALWRTGWYEARTVAALIEESDRVSASQMDAWCREFDNWGICDTVCFKVFDRTPHAFAKVKQWARRKEEFRKRAAFALLASLALHDKGAEDAQFLRCLPLVEQGARDERNFVKKGVSWALRSMGMRSPGLNRAVVELAGRLTESEVGSARWVGKEALKDLARDVARRRLNTNTARAAGR